MIKCVVIKKIMNKIKKILLIIFLRNVYAQDPTANLPQGRIVGIKVYTQNSIAPIEVFFGIPYAAPPVGRYRFSAPVRHPGWKRTIFAHRIPPQCPQLDVNGKLHTSEDCLYLNVWTPRRADGKLLPVVVILYSESWAGGGISLPCQELAAEGLVVVTVSYRLYILSFFTLQSITARGNLALLDQYMALLWIRDNIAAFGGDPTAITLLGHSTGADSVLHHIASPRAVGLFQKAILMSPREIWKSLNQESLDINEPARKSREIAQYFGCGGGVDFEILQCLRKVPIKDILSVYTNNTWTEAMRPILDNFLPETEQYLPRTLTQALDVTTLNIDVLLGTTELEAVSNDKYLDELLKLGTAYVSEYTNEKVIPEILNKLSLNAPESKQTLIHAILWEYLGMKTQNNTEAFEAVEILARIQSSAYWGAGSVLLASRLDGRVGRIYLYRYSQTADTDLIGHQNRFKGAIHGSDLIVLLGDPLMLQIARKPVSAEQKQMSSMFRKKISNFIKYGSPSSDEDWLRYRNDDPYIYDVRIDGSIKYSHNALREPNFWLLYLPLLMRSQTSAHHTEQLTSNDGNHRLRGGVFAMCGVSFFLLLLLLASAFLLIKEKMHRKTHFDESSKL